MAKMTIGPVTYEGTPEELQAIVASFPTDDATQAEPKIGDTVRIVSLDGNPKPSASGFSVGDIGKLTRSSSGRNEFEIARADGLYGYVSKCHIENVPAPVGLKTEKRHAKVGERILITRDESSDEQTYKLDDVLTVTKTNVCSRGDVNVEGQPSFVDYLEYEVIIEKTQAPAKVKAPADKLTHKGADYSLVQRKAQAGDVVYVTKDAEGTAAIPNGAKYLVDVDGRIDSFEVYPKHYNRTEANVLVYEKVAETLKVGDTVEVIDGSDSYFDDLRTGTIGEITEIDNDYASYPIRVDTDDDYDRFPASALRKVEAPVAEDKPKYSVGDIVQAKRVVGSNAIIYGEISGLSDCNGNYAVNSFIDGMYRAVYGDSIVLVAYAKDRVDTK